MPSNVLQATLEHAIKTPSNSAAKKHAIDFVARLVLASFSLRAFLSSSDTIASQLETELQYRGGFKVGRTSADVKKFEEWLIHLPKVLWELGSNHPSTTEVILRFLLRLCQRKSCLIHQEVGRPFSLFLIVSIN